MPHLVVDYSPNMETRTDLAALCNVLRETAISTGVFPMAGVRVRAIRADHVSIADGQDIHGYVDITVRLREGRDADTKKRAANVLFEAAQSFLAPAMAVHPVALSLEIRDMQAEFALKGGTIRDHLNTEDTR